MSTKKLQKTLDTVKGDVRELTEAFWALRDEVMTQQAVRAAESQSQTNGSHTLPDANEGSDISRVSPAPGTMQLSGHYEMVDRTGGTRELHWTMSERSVEEVLTVPVDDVAEMLAAIGHRQRLGIALMLLRGPATANEIVAGLSLGTTGAAYHHLNVLQRSGLVEQAQRGVFSIALGQVASLIAILAALSGNMTSTVEERAATSDPEDETETSATADL